jgi:hypothetical protein
MRPVVRAGDRGRLYEEPETHLVLSLAQAYRNGSGGTGARGTDQELIEIGRIIS